MKIKGALIILFILSASASFSVSKSFKSADMIRAGEPVIGKTIPFRTFDAFYNGKITTINLDDYKGKWIILFFYPADFTFVCPTELKEMSDYYNDFKEGGAEIFSISTDSAYVHKAWMKDTELLKNIKFPMLSDRSGNFSNVMQVYDRNSGTANRASFIIDPDGIIVAAEYSSDSIGRNAGELLRKFDAAVAVRKGGGLCPAGWKEGSELIKGE
ncbi:MAG TPA: peroxiredoxin [Spirochaetota bacterium]|nr:peroxiredoxin [Spirochaetota bacterium]HPS87304.1 peroxiredoxin [Spirochaetota bacterium]